MTTAEEIGFLYCDSLPSLPEQEAVAGLLSSLRKGNYTLSLQTFPEGDDQGVERYMEVSDSLIYVEDRQGGIPFASYGYLGAEGGVIPYEVTGGIMKAIGPAEEGSIASALPPFDLDPAFFRFLLRVRSDRLLYRAPPQRDARDESRRHRDHQAPLYGR